MKASTRKITHPAIGLFEAMFREAAASDPIVMPEFYVETSIFLDRLAAAGIEHESNFVRLGEWRVEIGLDKLARRLVREEHRRCGTTPTPDRRAIARGYRKLERLGLCTAA